MIIRGNLIIRSSIIILGLFVSQCIYAADYQADIPDVVLENIPFEIVINRTNPVATAESVSIIAGDATLASGQFESDEIIFDNLTITNTGNSSLSINIDGTNRIEKQIRVVSGWLSIIPPLLAILAALLFRSTVPSLFFGIWFGAWIVIEMSITGLFRAMLDTIQVYVLQAIIDPDHAAILLFTSMIGGMAGIISQNGGMQGIVNHIVRWANTHRKGQLSVWFMGLCIFIDDYTNVLVVGNSLRPLSDKLRISREKLAYLIDSTAAPVACIPLISTWVSYQVGLIGDSIATFHDFNQSAYIVFLHSIAYSFYPILTIMFVFAIAYTGLDFGPMHKAEKRARIKGQVYAPGTRVIEVTEHTRPENHNGMKFRALNAIIPLLTLIVAVVICLYLTGEGENLQSTIGSSDPFKSLMWASSLSVIVAAVLTLGQRIMTLEQIVEAWTDGVRMMLPAVIILILAWSISDLTIKLHTADYLVSWLGDRLNAGFIPAIAFILAAVTAFATGTSWGTMGILTPIFLPLVWTVLLTDGVVASSDYHILYSTVACILSGSVWGDHCSPISDTTILSSMASGCHHIDHVLTQIPYALLVGSVAILFGTLPTGFGLPWWLSMIIGACILAVALKLFGRKIEMNPSDNTG